MNELLIGLRDYICGVDQQNNDVIWREELDVTGEEVCVVIDFEKLNQSKFEKKYGKNVPLKYFLKIKAEQLLARSFEDVT